METTNITELTPSNYVSQDQLIKSKVQGGQQPHWELRDTNFKELTKKLNIPQFYSMKCIGQI